MLPLRVLIFGYDELVLTTIDTVLSASFYSATTSTMRRFCSPTQTTTARSDRGLVLLDDPTPYPAGITAFRLR
jgi:hypothetical protein